jgi:hypothetical protein
MEKVTGVPQIVFMMDIELIFFERPKSPRINVNSPFSSESNKFSGI